MPRSTVLIVCFLALMAVAAGVIMIAFPKDTPWLMAALMPIAMLGVFIVTISTPPESPAAKRRTPDMVVAPGQNELHTSSAMAETGAGSQAERQFPGGVWSGTLKLRPADGRGPLSLVPIRMALSSEPIRASLVPCGASGRPERVVAVDVAEYDSQRNTVYLRIAVERQGRTRCQEFTTRLVLQDHTLLPEDDTELATLELSRTFPSTPSAADHCQFPG